MVTDVEKIIKENNVLEADRIRLRRYTLEDTDAVYDYGSDERVLKYLRWEGLKEKQEAQDTILGFYKENIGVYAIALKDTNLCIGCIDMRLKTEHEKVGFGYLLNYNYWVKGYMTEALTTLINFSFTKLEANRVEAIHYVQNGGSGRVMEKSGMKQEGISKQEEKVKGIFYDVVHYGLIREEWERR